MAGGHVALLEHAGADGADLGPVVGAEDGGHQVAALLARHPLAGGQQLYTYVFRSTVLVGLYKYPQILGFGFHAAFPPSNDAGRAQKLKELSGGGRGVLFFDLHAAGFLLGHKGLFDLGGGALQTRTIVFPAGFPVNTITRISSS